MPPLHSVFTVSLKPMTKMSPKPETPKMTQKPETTKIKLKSTTESLTHKIATPKLVSVKSPQPTLFTRLKWRTYKTSQKITIKERKLKRTKEPIKKDKRLKWRHGSAGKAIDDEMLRQGKEIKEKTTVLTPSNTTQIMNTTFIIPKMVPAIFERIKIFAAVSIGVSVAAVTIVFCVCMLICNLTDASKVNNANLKEQCEMMSPAEAAQIKECSTLRR